MIRRWFWLVLMISACGDGQPGIPTRITIPSGASVRAIADTLEANNIIGSARRFRTYVRITGADRELKAGTFDLETGMTVREATARLVEGRSALQPLVVREGWMLNEIAGEVERELSIDSAEFIDAARDPELLLRVGARGNTLEGYLYPTTYYVRVGASPPEVVEHMVEEFERHWNADWNRRLAELNMTRDELITLASIIEGEVQHDEDRKYVSSVYHNRLRRGMRLQADPTVIYALGRRRRLFERDYEFRSPYNTYQIDGLPPHPIGQPVEASMEAALNPASTDFLYFVADGTGRHVFSRTYREHRATIRRIRGG